MTHSQLILSLRYSMRFGKLQAKVYDKIDGALKIISLLSGTSAFVGLIAQNQTVTAFAGLIVATATIFDVIFYPGKKAAKTRELESKYSVLCKSANKLSEQELQFEIDSIYDPETPQIEALRPIAYNDMLTENGLSAIHAYDLTSWQRFLRTFA
jgi:hypothetical protein